MCLSNNAKLGISTIRRIEKRLVYSNFASILSL